MDLQLTRARAGAVLVAVGLCLVDLPVRASPWTVAPAGETSGRVDPEAVAAFEEGSNAYALGNYEQAVGHFERAFELSRRSELLFNLGQAYSRWYEISGDVAHLRKARKLLQNYLSYLDQNPEQADGESRAQAEQRLEEVERLLDEHQRGTNGADDGADAKKPVHQRAWFWVVLVGGAALVAGGVTTAVLLGRRKQDDGFDPELGTIGRGVAPDGLGFRF